ncbi:MAG: esterase family protein [Blastocatellia bacterium]|nr:esterase family protein [Blastocatellia bacterium]
MKHLPRLPFLYLLFVLAFGFFLQAQAPTTHAASRIRFKIGVDAALAPQPVSGRLLIFMTTAPQRGDMLEVNFFNPTSVWMTGVEVQNLTAGKEIEVDPDMLAFPAPFSSAPAGNYHIMALLDRDHSYAYSQTGSGDYYSPILKLASLTPNASEPVELKLTKVVPTQTLKETENIKLVEFESPSLSAFWGRPIKMQAGVVLPPSYADGKKQKYPTVYEVHGYGGNQRAAWWKGPEEIKAMGAGKLPEMIHVYLSAQCPLGHHVFADSVNNGPWGTALTKELIPYLEKTFRMDGIPSGRLLTGHSSGGWSTLWLQINYPDVFGGTWSTSPDPVDFRSFTGPNLTEGDKHNFFHDDAGKPYGLFRIQGRDLMQLDAFAQWELVQGAYGGQMASFEAVFSPRGENGQPMQLFNRATGRLNPEVAQAWERYDISRLLKANWTKLGPKLKGKLHIAVGTADTFHLEQPLYLLRDTLAELKSDARIEFIEGKDHFNLYQDGLGTRIAQEMYAVARPKAKTAAK